MNGHPATQDDSKEGTDRRQRGGGAVDEGEDGFDGRHGVKINLFGKSYF